MNHKIPALAALPLLFGLGSAQSAMVVDGAFSLLIDVSGSISTPEYNLQMDGYAGAFRNAGVQEKLLRGPNGKAAVNVVFFGSLPYTTSLDAFTYLSTAAEIDDFADVLDDFARPGSGNTGIGRGMQRSLDLLLAADAPITNLKIMDVSGDGTNNTGIEPAGQRDRAETEGVKVNGLAIGGTSLVNYYAANVITSGGFVVQASTFDDFGAAVLRKIDIEAGNIPEAPLPGTLALLGAGLLGFAALRRKVGKA
jgi:hypothetical protein